MGRRRRSREYALQALYQLDQTGATPEQVFASFWNGLDAPDEVRSFCQRLVGGVHRRRDELDRRITAAAEHWRLERMALVDRNVLRLALFEMIYDRQTPPAVVIDEAIEVARKFGSEQSARFVNGMLDALRLREEAAGENVPEDPQ